MAPPMSSLDMKSRNMREAVLGSSSGGLAGVTTVLLGIIVIGFKIETYVSFDSLLDMISLSIIEWSISS